MLRRLLAVVFASWALAHEEALRPVEVELKADASALRVRVAVHPDFWFGPRPPKAASLAGWPEKSRLAAERYLASRLSLSLDGRALQGRLAQCRYVHNPWQAPDEGRFVFALSYALPSSGGRLSGRSGFSADLPALSAKLRVLGARPLDFELSADKPSFELALADARRGALSRLWEGFSLGFAWLFSRAAGLLFACAAVLIPPRGWRSGAAAFAALAAALFLGGLSLPGRFLAAASWGALAWMGLSARLRLAWGWWAGLLIAAPLWAASASLAAPSGPLERAAFLAGVAASAAFWVFAAARLKALEAARAKKRSESLAERLLASRLRFAAALLAGLGLLGAWKAAGG